MLTAFLTTKRPAQTNLGDMAGEIMVPASESSVRTDNEAVPPPPIVPSADTMASSTAADALDGGEPCSVELGGGSPPRVVFRSVPGHRHDEPWQHRHVRAPPVVPGFQSGRLAYYNSSKTASNSNVLQVILRDHGYERVEEIEEDWSIFWCAGQVEPSILGNLLPHQRINKFPKATALTLKQNLWQCVKAMITKHGEKNFGFMPPTFVLPRELKAFEKQLRARLSEPSGADDVWIFKPAAVRATLWITSGRLARLATMLFATCRPAESTHVCSLTFAGRASGGGPGILRPWHISAPY